MNKEQLNDLLKARNKLCAFCENDGCEKCQVTFLINDAYAEWERAQDEDED